jgi:hypothetical protein
MEPGGLSFVLKRTLSEAKGSEPMEIEAVKQRRYKA